MTVSSRPKVTVYVPCHNYARFLREALDSVLAQILTSWELIIIDDGSTDDSRSIINEYAERSPDRILTFFNDTPIGLLRCANMALDAASGQYVMRLDADDFLDECALLAMAGFLDANPDIALVYPNYYYVDDRGDFLGIEIRKIIGKETKQLDLPAHGACTMVRRRILKSVGGYSEEFQSQDGYEMWLKISRRYRVANLTAPLFSYRQHETSLSSNQERILESRQRIKRSLAKASEGQVRPRIAAIVPVKNTYPDNPNIALRNIAGAPLLDYTMETVRKAGLFDAILFTTDDPAVVEHCAKWPDVFTSLRPESLSHKDRQQAQVVNDGLTRLENIHGIFPDIVVVLNIHTPLRTRAHIEKACDTLLLYDSDSVVSVMEDWFTHFTHGEDGLAPLNPAMMSQIRLEKEALFTDNGAIKAAWRDIISDESILGNRISHIVMTPEDSVIASTEANIQLIEHLLNKRRET